MGIQLRGGWGAAVMVRNLQLSANPGSLCEEENTSGMWLSQPALGALGGCFQSEMEGLPPVPPEMKPSFKQKPPPGEQSCKTRHWPVPCPSAVLGWLRTHCHVLPSHSGIKVPGGCHPIWEPFRGGNSPCPC